MTYLAVAAAVQQSNPSWDWIPLGRLARMRRETNFDSSSSLLALSSERGIEERPDDGGRQLPSDETIASYWRVMPNDLVFNPMWAIGGGVAVSPISGAVSTAYRVYIPSPAVRPRFLHYWLRSDIAIQQYHLLVRGITTFDRSIARTDFERMPVPIPPLDLQQAIADHLDAETTRIDLIVAKKQRMMELLETAFRSRRWAEISDKILWLQDKHLGVRAVTAQPPWTQTRLKFLVGRPLGGAWGSEPGIDDVDVECYRVADFDRWHASVANDEPTIRSVPKDTAHRLALAPGDLLLEKSGGGEKQPVGFVARFAGSKNIAICSNFIARLRPNPECDPQFLVHLFAGLYDRRLTHPFVKQTTGIQNLDTDAFLSQGWAIPSPSEQVAIRRRIDSSLVHATALITRLSDQIGLLWEHRQALITAALTGALDIPESAA